MALEGSLKDSPISDTLQRLATQKKTGLLTLSSEKEVVRLIFAHGNLLRGFYGDEDEQLSNMLIMAEKITITQLRAALHAKPQGISLAATFVNLSYLTRDELQTLNRVLTQETIVSLFFWESGDYRFEEDETFEKEDLYHPMSVDHILSEGTRQKETWPKLLEKISSREMIFEVVGEESPNKNKTSPLDAYGEKMDTLMDTEEHLWLLQWIDGTRTVGNIVNHTGVGAFAVYTCLIELLAIGRIQEKQIQAERTSFFSRFSLQQVHGQPLLLNGLLITLIIGGAFILIPSSFYGNTQTFRNPAAPLTGFQKLISVNQKDQIEFALDLYYVRHGYYPLSTDRLVEEGFLDKSIDFKRFLYSSDGKKFELALIP